MIILIFALELLDKTDMIYWFFSHFLSVFVGQNSSYEYTYSRIVLQPVLQFLTKIKKKKKLRVARSL